MQRGAYSRQELMFLIGMPLAWAIPAPLPPPGPKVGNWKTLFGRLAEKQHSDRRVREPRERLELSQSWFPLPLRPLVESRELLFEIVARPSGALNRPQEHGGRDIDVNGHPVEKPASAAISSKEELASEDQPLDAG